MPRQNAGLQAVYTAAAKLGVNRDMTASQLIATHCGVSLQAVCKWRHVPAHHVIRLETLTGVSRHTQRPDIFGPAQTKTKPRPKLRRPASARVVA